VVARALEEHGGGGGSIGFELDSNFLTVRDYERLRAALPNASPVDFSAVIWELRLRKSDAEIAYIKKAASIADEAMSLALRTVKEGVSEREVAALIAATYMELGASDGHLGPVISGARTASIHGQLGERVLTKGDVFHIELVPEYRGYSARMMRSAVIGEPTVEQERAMRVMVEAQDAQIAAMQPGALACDVDHILRGRIIAAGLRERFDNVSGYTLGFYGTPRSPRASDFTRCFLPDADWRLEPRMAFHMYVFAAGLSLSETVLVGEDGPERLTTLDRRLFVGG
jgi:Xaa-Pro dipeptidase